MYNANKGFALGELGQGKAWNQRWLTQILRICPDARGSSALWFNPSETGEAADYADYADYAEHAGMGIMLS